MNVYTNWQKRTMWKERTMRQIIGHIELTDAIRGITRGKSEVHDAALSIYNGLMRSVEEQQDFYVEQSSKIRCPKCDGAGAVSQENGDGIEDCWLCDGSGKVTGDDAAWYKQKRIPEREAK